MSSGAARVFAGAGVSLAWKFPLPDKLGFQSRVNSAEPSGLAPSTLRHLPAADPMKKLLAVADKRGNASGFRWKSVGGQINKRLPKFGPVPSTLSPGPRPRAPSPGRTLLAVPISIMGIMDNDSNAPQRILAHLTEAPYPIASFCVLRPLRPLLSRLLSTRRHLLGLDMPPPRQAGASESGQFRGTIGPCSVYSPSSSGR